MDDHVHPGDEAPFVGRGRLALLNGLVTAYNTAQTVTRPQWVHLSAPSGWGKTRTVREFYARIAARQTVGTDGASVYWPPRIVPRMQEQGHDAVHLRRKVVHPVFEHVPGTLPDFMWWGIACSTRNRQGMSAFAQDVGQFIAHAEYLDVAWRQRVGALERHRRSATRAVREVASEGGGVAFGAFLSVLGEWAGPIAKAISVMWDIGETTSIDRSRRKTLLESDQEISVDRSRAVDEVVEMITRLSLPTLPTVIFVEDAHIADDALLETLRRVHRMGRGSVMILTTSLPGHDGIGTPLGDVLAEFSDGIARLSHDDDPPGSGPLRGASLGRIETSDLSSMVRHHYPATDDATCSRIATRHPNPLELELFCHLPAVRARSVEGSLRIGEADLATFPSTLRDLYRDLWRDLPADLRRLLAVAACGIPCTMPRDASGDETWNASLLAEAVTSVDAVADIATVLGAIDRTDMYGWVRLLEEHLARFTERLQMEVAAGDDDFLFDDDRRKVRSALAARLVAAGGSDLPIAERIHRAHLVMALHAEGFLDDGDCVGEAALLLIDETTREDDATARLALAERGLAAGPPPDHELPLLLARAAASGLLDPRGAGIDHFNEFFEAARRTVNDESTPEHLKRFALGQFVSGLMFLQQFEQASTSGRMLLDWVRQSPDADPAQLYTAWHNVATCEYYLGRHRAAIDEFAELLKTLLERDPGEDRRKFETRKSIALAWISAGDTAAGIKWMEKAREAYVPEDRAGNIERLLATAQLAEWLTEIDEQNRARELRLEIIASAAFQQLTVRQRASILGDAGVGIAMAAAGDRREAERAVHFLEAARDTLDLLAPGDADELVETIEGNLRACRRMLD